MFWSVEGQIDVEMEKEQKHFSLQWTVYVLSAYVVLQSDLGQMFANDLGILFVVLVRCAYHLHFLQSRHIRILLQQRTYYSPISKVFVEISQSSLLQQYL